MLINVSEDYVINSLSDMNYMYIGKLEGPNKIEKIGSIKYDYVIIKEDELIFYTDYSGTTMTTLKLEINKIDYIDFDAKLIVIK